MATGRIDARQESLLVAFLQAAADGELAAEQARVRLCETEGFELYDLFRDLQSIEGSLSVNDIRRAAGGGILSSSFADVSAMLEPFSTPNGTIPWDGFLRLVLPRDPANAHIRQRALSRRYQAIDWRNGHYSHEAMEGLRRLLDTEMGTHQQLVSHWRRVEDLGFDSDLMTWFSNVESTRRINTQQELGPMEYEALLRRMNIGLGGPFGKFARHLQGTVPFESSAYHIRGDMSPRRNLTPRRDLTPQRTYSPRHIDSPPRSFSPRGDIICKNCANTGFDFLGNKCNCRWVRNYLDESSSRFNTEGILRRGYSPQRNLYEDRPYIRSPSRSRPGSPIPTLALPDPGVPRLSDSVHLSPRSSSRPPSPSTLRLGAGSDSPRGRPAFDSGYPVASPQESYDTWGAPSPRNRPRSPMIVRDYSHSRRPQLYDSRVWYHSRDGRYSPGRDISPAARFSDYSPRRLHDVRWSQVDAPYRACLHFMLRQADADRLVEDTKRGLPLTCTVEAAFAAFDRNRKGYVSECDMIVAMQESGGRANLGSFADLGRDIHLRRPSGDSCDPARLSLRELGVLLLPIDSQEYEVAARSLSDSEARNALFELATRHGGHLHSRTAFNENYFEPLPMGVKVQLYRVLETALRSAEDVARERRRLAFDCGTLQDVFHAITAGRHGFTMSDLRRAFSDVAIRLQEQDLSLIWYRYASHGGSEVNLHDFTRQLLPFP